MFKVHGCAAEHFDAHFAGIAPPEINPYGLDPCIGIRLQNSGVPRIIAAFIAAPKLEIIAVCLGSPGALASFTLSYNVKMNHVGVRTLNPGMVRYIPCSSHDVCVEDFTSEADPSICSKRPRFDVELAVDGGHGNGKYRSDSDFKVYVVDLIGGEADVLVVHPIVINFSRELVKLFVNTRGGVIRCEVGIAVGKGISLHELRILTVHVTTIHKLRSLANEQSSQSAPHSLMLVG